MCGRTSGYIHVTPSPLTGASLLVPGWHAVGRQAMSSSRVALVSDDPRLATSIQAHLKKSLGQNVFQCSFESIRNHLGQETDGLLMLATVSVKESDQILQLVREIYIRKLPP